MSDSSTANSQVGDGDSCQVCRLEKQMHSSAEHDAPHSPRELRRHSPTKHHTDIGSQSDPPISLETFEARFQQETKKEKNNEREHMRSPFVEATKQEGEMCEVCYRRPKYRDEAAGITHPYCGKTCARTQTKLHATHLSTPSSSHHSHLSATTPAGSSTWGAHTTHHHSPVPLTAPPTMGHRVPSVSSSRPSHTSHVIMFYNSDAPHYGFTNFSAHPIEYMDKVYPTSEHLFQALKFMKDRPDVAEKIRQYERPRDAFDEAHRFHTDVRSDWSEVSLKMMDEVLSLKFQQHPNLRKELLETGNALLVEDSPRDDFWGIGQDRQGRNELGKCLMRLRDDIRKSLAEGSQK